MISIRVKWFRLAICYFGDLYYRKGRQNTRLLRLVAFVSASKHRAADACLNDGVLKIPGLPALDRGCYRFFVTLTIQ